MWWADPEVVFAPKLEQLKLVEKTVCKRQRSKDVVDDSAKREALRQCRKMPGARGSLLMAALDSSSSHLHKKRVLSPRKNGGKRMKHHRNLISRNLATS